MLCILYKSFSLSQLDTSYEIQKFSYLLLFEAWPRILQCWFQLQEKPTNTGMGSLSLLQGIFPAQESDQGLLPYSWILYQLSYQGRLSLRTYLFSWGFWAESNMCRTLCVRSFLQRVLLGRISWVILSTLEIQSLRKISILVIFCTYLEPHFNETKVIETASHVPLKSTSAWSEFSIAV